MSFIVGVIVATLILTVLIQSGIINLKGNSFNSIKKIHEKITSDFKAVSNSMLKGFKRGIKDSPGKENQSSCKGTDSGCPPGSISGEDKG